jgi:putative oxidoreductase
MKQLLATDDRVSSLFLRVALGVVMFPHGAQKVFGWWGGNGFSATMDHFTQGMGIPWILALLVVLAEFLGSIGLVVGFLTRVAAFGIGATMVGAVSMVHWKNGFFMDWANTPRGEGYEYHLLAIGMCLALVASGAGRLSVDRAMTRGGTRSA